jgi:hypothetical protein
LLLLFPESLKELHLSSVSMIGIIFVLVVEGQVCYPCLA